MATVYSTYRQVQHSIGYIDCTLSLVSCVLLIIQQGSMTQAKNDEKKTVYSRFLEDTIRSLSDHVPFGNLNNDVHPLYQQAACTDVGRYIDDIEDHTYQAMLPALRLASILQQSLSNAWRKKFRDSQPALENS
jgi:hypothetical protein